MENHRFRENINDKSLRQYFNQKNNTPNKRYKPDDYERLRRQYHILLDANREQQRVNRNVERKNQNQANKFLGQIGEVAETVDLTKITRKRVRQINYKISQQKKFFVLNIPKSFGRCLKVIKDKNQEDTMFSYRNLMSRRNNKINKYSFEVSSIQDIKNKLVPLYRQQKNAFKVSIQFSFVFEAGDGYKVFDATSNKFYKEAVLITNMKQLKTLMNSFNLDDIETYINSMRPSTAHKIIGITTLDVKIFDMSYRIGANIELPEFIMKNQNINSMVDSTNNMCFWNCLAFHNTKERKCFSQGKQLYEKFYNKKPNKTYLGFDIHN
jgi:hypothetical protein